MLMLTPLDILTLVEMDSSPYYHQMQLMASTDQILKGLERQTNFKLGTNLNYTHLNGEPQFLVTPVNIAPNQTTADHHTLPASTLDSILSDNASIASVEDFVTCRTTKRETSV